VAIFIVFDGVYFFIWRLFDLLYPGIIHITVFNRTLLGLLSGARGGGWTLEEGEEDQRTGDREQNRELKSDPVPRTCTLHPEP
jgi:hypothetical protein